MLATEERIDLEVPPSRRLGVRWWIVAAIGTVALAFGVLAGVLIDGGGEDSSDVAISAVDDGPSGFALDLAERWGAAMETGDDATVRALYTTAVDGRATIVDRLYRAVWTDVDGAIESITSGNDFVRFDPVRVEEILPYSAVQPGSGMIVAEYEVDVASEESGEASGLPSSVVVVFHNLDSDGLIGDSDIYFPVWSSFVTGDVGGYPQRATEEGWIIID